MTAPDVATIAAVLSKAQRYWIGAAHEERGRYWTCPPHNTLEVLVRLGLMTRGSAYLRPLGLLVRHYLEQEQGGTSSTVRREEG